MFNLFDKDKLHIDDNSKMSFLVPVIIFFMAGIGILIVSNDLSSIVFASADIKDNNNNFTN